MTTLFSERAAGGVVEARKDGASLFSFPARRGLFLTNSWYLGPSEILTIYDRKSSTLLDIREMDEYDEDEVPLRTSLLAR